MIGCSGNIRLAGDGLLEITEDRLKELIKIETITDVYHVEQTPFARGKFASVRKLIHKTTGTQFAGKFIRRRRRAVDSARDIAHEVAVLELCSGSGKIVKLHEVYETRAEVALVLELATGGELQRFLDTDVHLCEIDARSALAQTLQGLEQLHRHNIAHLDLKPQNLLVWKSNDQSDQDDSENDQSLGEVKLCDFGISRVITPGVEVREILGTPDYVAPEVLQYEPLSLATDIWSVGVLAYVLLSGFSPFAGDTKQETFLNITQGDVTFPEELFENVSSEAKKFITACLKIQPSARLTVEECLQHAWLKQVFPQNPLESANTPDTEKPQETSEDIKKLNNENNKPVKNIIQEYKDSDIIDKRFTKNIDDTNLTYNYDKKIKPKSEIISKCIQSLSSPFPDAPTTPKVSRKSLPDSPNSVLNLCKKFQPDLELKKSSVCRFVNDKKVVTEIFKSSSIEDAQVVIDVQPENLSKNQDQDREKSQFTSSFDQTDTCPVTYTVTCLTCSQCDSQCCHVVRSKSLEIDRGIIC